MTTSDLFCDAKLNFDGSPGLAESQLHFAPARPFCTARETAQATLRTEHADDFLGNSSLQQGFGDLPSSGHDG